MTKLSMTRVRTILILVIGY